MRNYEKIWDHIYVNELDKILYKLYDNKLETNIR